MVRYAAKLSVADQVCPQTHSPLLSTFRHDRPLIAYERMKLGVSRLIRNVPWLAGQVGRGDQGFTTLFWDDNVTGDEVQLEYKDGTHLPSYQELADAGMNLHDLDFDFKPHGCLTREEEPRDREAALLIAFTELRGGFVTTFAVMHQVTDGVGQIKLLKLWASMTAGRGAAPDEWCDPRSPLTRYQDFMDAIGLQPSDNHKQAVTVNESQVHISPDHNAERVPTAIPIDGKPRKLARKIFPFSSEAVEQLRRAIASQTGQRPPHFVSALAGLFWILIADIRRQRGVAAESTNGDLAAAKSGIFVVTSARTSFPKLSPDYMGNFLSPAFASSNIAELTSFTTFPNYGTPDNMPGVASLPNLYPRNLASASRLISVGLHGALDPVPLKAKLQFIANIPDARMLARAGGTEMGANDILLSSWTLFHEFPDFGPGVGCVEAQRVQPTPAETRRPTFAYMIVLPRRKGGDGKAINEVFACFEEEDMKLLEQHPMLKAWLYDKPTFAKPEVNDEKVAARRWSETNLRRGEHERAVQARL